MSVAAVTRTPWSREGEMLVSPIMRGRGLVAGFTTRASGSMGGSGTAPDAAARDRDALAARLGFDAVVRVRQVHGDRVLRADGPFAEKWPEADALWTDRPGVLLGVVAADCVPVLVADDAGRIGAAHAGWEGTTREVAPRLVAALRDAGADPARLVASLGPSIGPCCYAVGPERVATIRERLGPDADRAIVAHPGGMAFDLWTANADQLARSGVGAIEVSGTCTRCGGEDLWSRRGGDIGLLGIAVIGRRA
jgi:YfiH family protein